MARRPVMNVKLESFDAEKAMLEKLAQSGLTAAQARALELEPLTQAPEELPEDRGGFRIPYFTPEGLDSGFYRFRYLQPPKLSGFQRAAPGLKVIRYAQPRGSSPQAYFPRLGGVNWRELLADPARPLLITEGELKAASATALGIPTMGLGGVWSWLQEKVPIPDLVGIAWQGRPVVIAYDSDAAENEKVIAAENALARWLTGQGASARIARIPRLEGQAKTGLDDYLVALGLDALRGLLADAQPWGPQAMLHELNAEVCYLRDQGAVYVHADGRCLRPDAFVQHAYAPWRYIDASGDKPREKSAPAEWLRWKARAELAGLTFAPGQGPRHEGRVNTWQGWGTKPLPGDCEPWLQLARYLIPNPTHLTWFLQWCAYPLQHPGTKLYTAVLLVSRQHGTGKTALTYALGAIHGAGFIEIKNKDLRNGFNGWLARRTFIYGDEITAAEARVDADYLKGLITQAKALINEKYMVPYNLPDCANYLFSSNHPDALFMEDSDRRFAVFEADVPPLPQDFYDRYDAWLKGDGPAALHDYLMSIDTSGFNPRARAIETQAKLEMIDACRSDVGSWVARLRRDPAAIATVNGNRYPWKLWTTGELLAMYDPERKTRVTANGLGRELKKQGFTKAAGGLPCPCKTGQHRLWAIVGEPREFETISPTEGANFYNRERGEKPRGKRY